MVRALAGRSVSLLRYQRNLHQALKYFFVGVVAHFWAWSPILCQFGKALSQTPEQLPTKILIGTGLILFFYVLFIVAQSTVVIKTMGCCYEQLFGAPRTPNGTDHKFCASPCCGVANRNWEYQILAPAWMESSWFKLLQVRCMAVLAIRDVWSFMTLSLFWFGLGIVAIVQSVYRTDVAEDRTQQPQENYAQLTFLIIAGIAFWAVCLLVDRCCVNYSKQTQQSHKADQWCVCSRTCAKLATGVCIVAAMYFAWDAMLADGNFGPHEHVWLALLTLLTTGVTVLLFMMLGDKLARTDVVRRVHTVEESVSYKRLAQLHVCAAWFHMALILLSTFLGFVKDDVDGFNGFVRNWLLVNQKAYVMSPDYRVLFEISKDPTNATKFKYRTNEYDQTVVSYCASRNGFPIAILALSMLWSIASIIQHLHSYYAMTDQIAMIKRKFLRRFQTVHCTKFTCCCNKAYLSIVLIFAFVVLWIVFYVSGNDVTVIEAIGLAALYSVITTLCVALCAQLCEPNVNYDTLFLEAKPPTEDDSSSSDECEQGAIDDRRLFRQHKALRTSQIAKWKEYIFSASAMHFVLVYFTGSHNIHEIMQTTVICAVSLYFAMLSDRALISAERGAGYVSRDLPVHTNDRTGYALSIHDQVMLEMPFMLLSFFSKGILDVALTLPALRAGSSDASEWVTEVNKCSYNSTFAMTV